MVKLSLISAKGNAARYFPHQGYLALTPIKLEGVVRTRLDDDRKFLQASDLFVAVRCYEARIARTGDQHTNLLVDHRVPLWSKPPDQPWADLGDGDWPFRVLLPASVPGHSTAHFQEYRVFWRIEAVLNHIPMLGLGHRQVKTFDLPLLRYAPGAPLPPAPTTWEIAPTTKFAPLRYRINAPPFPLGPLDLVPVSLKLVPADPHVRVAALALALQRRLEFNGPPDDDADPALSSSAHLVDPRPALKSTTFLVASAHADDVPRDEHGVFAKTLTLQIPTPKSNSHWAVGETMRTALVTLRFFLHVKVTLAHAHGGPTETLELAARELCLVATNEAQRRLAASKHADAARARRPSPSPPAAATTAPAPAKPPKAARRPHTSSGLRDRERRARTRHTASDRGTGEGTVSHPDDVRAWEDELARIEARSHWRTVAESPTVRSAPALRAVFGEGVDVGARAEVAASPRALEFEPTAPLAAEWEEELERIAAQSRRRSVAIAERRTRPRIEVAVPT